MKLPDRKTLILSFAILVLGVLLVISKCTTSKQSNQDTISAVAQSKIETLESAITTLQNMNKGYHATQDSLIQKNKELDKQLAQKEAKYAVIALKYVKELNRVKELPNDSAVGLFLDVADCSEVPVIKYDNDYIIPIEPIRFYNNVVVSMDELKEVNWNIREESSLKTMQIKNLDLINKSMDSEIRGANAIIENKNSIIEHKDTQLKASEKKYKKQVVKTYLVGTAGALLLALSLIF